MASKDALVFSASFLASFLGACATSTALKNPWAEVREPKPGPAESIGSYDQGCLAGAVSLPPDAPGLRVMRISRRRFYGHPLLREFLVELGKKAKKARLGEVLVGDLSQARGGFNYPGHSSHQSGLDVDLWYQLGDSEPLTLDERENRSAKSVLLGAGLGPNSGQDTGLDPSLWNAQQEKLLELAASSQAVERIFVDRWIKKALCQKHGQKTTSVAWLRKLRPWWKHDDHFHVRLHCPPDSPQCEKQSPLPAGDGCDETLEWWFSEDAARVTAERAAAAPKKLEVPEPYPGCKEILDWKE